MIISVLKLSLIAFFYSSDIHKNFSLFPIPCSLFPLLPTPDSRFPIPYSLLPTPYSLFPLFNSQKILVYR
ncbi:MAG: hypothetical protein F6K56_20385 [Moorea sp. SIO3G5]|nr:hypothetical protein [Moorena sp. SIO3G5]